MTWVKLGVEFSSQCMDLSNAAFRLHVEVIHHLYQTEEFSLVVAKRHLGRISAEAAAAPELVAVRFWDESDTGYEVIHHADVIRQSLAAQILHREREKARQQKKRGGQSKEDPAVGTNVAPNVADMSYPTQTDSHTDKQSISSEQINRMSEDLERIWPTTASIPKSKAVDCLCGKPLGSYQERERGQCNRCFISAKKSA